MKPPSFLDDPALHLTSPVRKAMDRTIEASAPAFQRLPAPVRFRASGALRAWRTFLEAHRNALEHLSSASSAPAEALLALEDVLVPMIGVAMADETLLQRRLRSLLLHSVDLLAFWSRDGALYEPTEALGTMLIGSDVSQDLPMGLLQLPCPALCIVPPWQQRHKLDGASAIVVFEHEPHAPEPVTRRMISVRACIEGQRGVAFKLLTLGVGDESETLAVVVERSMAATQPVARQRGFTDEYTIEEGARRWRLVLDYVVKVLLYLRLDDALVQAHARYTAAPKQFPGLGRRKREAKLAEVEQLYDRYIIGPSSLREAVRDQHGQNAVGISQAHELSAHWRRGHFRMQPYGPKAALRKVLFIAPTIVRADTLDLASDVGPTGDGLQPAPT